MLGLILVIIIGLSSFIYITVFYAKKADGMEEFERIKYSRKKLKVFANSLMKAINADVKIIYEDKAAMDKIDPKDGIVFISNHSSNLDIPILISKIPLDIGFVAKKEMEEWPFYSQWMKRGGSVFLDRENPREGIKAIKAAVKLVKKGHPILIFPQGKRSDGIKEGDFKKGSFKLALDSQGIVVPVTLIGCDQIQKPDSKWIYRNKKVKMVIGAPVNVSQLGEEEQKNLNRYIESKIILAYKQHS